MSDRQLNWGVRQTELDMIPILSAIALGAVLGFVASHALFLGLLGGVP
jgi:hypothetical protein